MAHPPEPGIEFAQPRVKSLYFARQIAKCDVQDVQVELGVSSMT